jgi:hypothetical protein
MNGEEGHLSREELVEREHQARLREYGEWPKRLEELCREAEIGSWTARTPDRSSAAPHGPHTSPGWCVRVPVRLAEQGEKPATGV